MVDCYYLHKAGKTGISSNANKNDNDQHRQLFTSGYPVMKEHFVGQHKQR